MWIRSQDKEKLANANDINIIVRDSGVWIYVNDIKFAVYSTKEKAVKVLDKIEKLINRSFMYDYQLGGVFQMPNDDEVKE